MEPKINTVCRPDASFHIFTELPVELQMEIFKHATEERRRQLDFVFNAHLEVKKGRWERNWAEGGWISRGTSPWIVIPPLLFTNSLSRAVAYDSLTKGLYSPGQSVNLCSEELLRYS